MKDFLRETILFAISKFPKKQFGASILAYHSVAINNVFFTVKPENFSRQLDIIKNSKLSVIKLSELVFKLKSGQDIKNCVCLTFDDGYKDNFTNVFPVLNKYNFPATIFLITGRIGQTSIASDGTIFEMLNPGEIKKMHESGLVEFFPHTRNHPKLTELELNTAIEEIENSYNDLVSLVGETKKILAYPKGRYNNNHIEYLKNNNWLAAVSTQDGLILGSENIYFLKRNSVDRSTSLCAFKIKISSRLDIYMKLRGIFK